MDKLKKIVHSTAFPFITSIILILYMLYSVILYTAHFQKNINSQYQQRLEETGNQVAKDVYEHMNSSCKMLKILSSDFGRYEDIHCDEALMQLTLYSKKTDFTRLWLTKGNGYAISSEGTKSDASGREYLADFMKGSSGISAVQYSRVNPEEKNVVMYVPIYHEHEITGAIIGIYRLEGLESTVNIDCFNGSGNCCIFSYDGTVLVQDSEALPFGNSINTTAPVTSALSTSSSGFIRYNSDGYERLGYYCPVGINDWYLFVTLPDEIITQEYHTNLLRSILLCIQIIFIAAILMVLFFSRRNRILKNQAQNDLLTQLYNRGTMEHLIDQYLVSPPPQSLQGFIIFDVDKFKSINDHLGHPVGDIVLREIAKTMKAEFRAKDLLGRMGGDEFAIFMPDIPGYQNVKNKADFFAKQIKHALHKSVPDTDITISIGISMTDYTASFTFKQLYESADKKLYTAKHNGGNCTVI